MTRFGATSAEALPPLGVYIHWPFCTAICPYCDFNVHGAHKNNAAVTDWQAAYKAELTHAYALRPGGKSEAGKVETVFFGGGTPSLMPPHLVAAILADIDALWGLADNAEISLEANPVSAPRPHLQALRAAGVTRLSLGVQAFDDDALKALGRTHSAAEAQEAFLAAQDIFDTASFDLIYARPVSGPQQNPEQAVEAGCAAWQRELSAALALSPQHMSLYQLTIEPDTVFHSRAAQGRLAVPHEDMAAALYEATQRLCTAAGLPAYEISNHAIDGHHCRHNSAIWHGGDYVGIGPGAHGRITIDGRKHASMAHKQPQLWLAACLEDGHGWQSLTALSAQEAAEEAVMLGLRLADGVGVQALVQRGVALDPQKLTALKQDGLLAACDDVVQATDKGRLLLDYMIGRLLA
ncbi:MAG: radical SAM family heme chaperone HemW [Alphaproteobacteria bacterium]|nr:radical SAM family heme chaperone HemW [Alphaproteobacteria bacterium]